MEPPDGSLQRRIPTSRTEEHTMTLTLDLHPIFRNEREIDRAVRAIIFEAVRTKADTVEIIPGKGSGKLKRRVLALLKQGHIRRMYQRIETDESNDGRVIVHFR
jgi:DNA-nicking Smr family endonuclease